ncbi:hypothetical protein ACMFMF_010332 [Clarireedia jacksonii]
MGAPLLVERARSPGLTEAYFILRLIVERQCLGRADLLHVLPLTNRAWTYFNRCGSSGGDDGPIGLPGTTNDSGCQSDCESTDGSCGALNNFKTCPVGQCCSSNGRCGSGDGFCGLGCQPGSCVVGTCDPVSIDLVIWNQPNPTLQCFPPCTFVLPPRTLSSALTISMPPATELIEETWPSTVLDGYDDLQNSDQHHCNHDSLTHSPLCGRIFPDRDRLRRQPGPAMYHRRPLSPGGAGGGGGGGENEGDCEVTKTASLCEGLCTRTDRPCTTTCLGIQGCNPKGSTTTVSSITSLIVPVMTVEPYSQELYDINTIKDKWGSVTSEYALWLYSNVPYLSSKWENDITATIKKPIPTGGTLPGATTTSSTAQAGPTGTKKWALYEVDFYTQSGSDFIFDYTDTEAGNLDDTCRGLNGNPVLDWDVSRKLNDFPDSKFGAQWWMNWPCLFTNEGAVYCRVESSGQAWSCRRDESTDGKVEARCVIGTKDDVTCEDGLTVARFVAECTGDFDLQCND